MFSESENNCGEPQYTRVCDAPTKGCVLRTADILYIGCPLQGCMGFGKDGKGAIIREKVNAAALGALAAEDGIVVSGGVTLGSDFRILKSEIRATVIGLTATEGVGLSIYMANGDLVEADIENCLETNGPTDRNDRDSAENAERWVHLLGVMSRAVGTEEMFENDQGGHILVAKPRWSFSNPEGWKYFVYNDGVVLTTGATVELMATHYGVWVT